MALELNGHCGEDLADLLLPALGADGDGFVVRSTIGSTPNILVVASTRGIGAGPFVSLAHPHYGLPWGFETGLWL